MECLDNEDNRSQQFSSPTVGDGNQGPESRVAGTGRGSRERLT